MTERDMKRDLCIGIIAFAIIMAMGVNIALHRALTKACAERDAWKRTAHYWEGSWTRWAAQLDTLPPHGTAKPDRGN